ncbi:MAG TPA: XdhC/CoxI family protein [Nitrospirota bacterium]|nr:XdhC/CoxI family protein [Nitrospirota bacterium]
MQIYEEVLRLKRMGRTSAIATIVECRGSSPQKQGAKMLVRDDGSTMGTLGGGCLEADVVQAARMAMRDGNPMTLPFELTEQEGGLVCGGTVLVYVEPVLLEPHLVVLGAGHIGKTLSKLARFTGFRVTVVDDRAEFANRENIPDATDIVVNEFTRAFEQIPIEKDTAVVVATRGHNHDLDAVKAALMTKATYIGLLGSRRKKALLFKALEDVGFPREDIGRVVIPVGLPIGSVTPEEIAVSIMAQIIERRRANGSQGIGAASRSRLLQQDGTDQTASPDR